MLLPCYNEEAAIAKTVAGFRAALPEAAIYVYDNNSRDRTREVAAAAGAIVRTERQQGKGNVVRRMFADVDADVYIMADGDLTYDPNAAPAMVDMLLDEHLDMIVGARKHEQKDAYRGGHVLGNRVFTGIIVEAVRPQFHRHLLGVPGVFTTVCEELPGAVGGFRDRNRDERPCPRAPHARRRGRNRLCRAAGGVAVQAVHLSRRLANLKTITTLYRTERPALFFGAIGVWLIVLALLLSVPLIVTYLHTHLVPRLPTAILITGLVIIAVLCLFAGLILDTVTRGRREMRRLAYLAQPAPASARRAPRLPGSTAASRTRASTAPKARKA